MRDRTTLLAAALCVLAHCPARGEVTREALEQLYVEPAAVAARALKAPTIDGKLDDDAWRAAEPLAFGFSDPTSPGRPKNATDLRLACDERRLYVAFDCKELREIKANVEGQYNEKLPSDDHVSIVLLPEGHAFCDAKHANVCLLVKVNPKGATWARKYRYLEGDARP